MRIENGQLILERKDCNNCYKGTVATKKWKVCPKCKGSGKRGNGRCGSCNSRTYFDQKSLVPGQVYYWDHDDRQVCPYCNGDFKDFKPESYNDKVDATSIPIEVQRSNRTMGWAESHIGAGVYTIVDYGRYKTQTDEQLIEQVRKEMNSVYGGKIVKSKEDLTVCDKIVIVTGDQGFSAIPLWDVA